MTAPPPDSILTLDTRHLGRLIHVYDRADSTNTLALALASDPTQHGLAMLAREQTAGRGQYGRTWVAPPESSVLLTVLLFPPPSLHRPALLTAWAAVSVCETILELGNLQAKIKWPNDVFVQGKKICGILIEQRTTGLAEFPLAAAVGIGLNVAQTPAFFAEAGLPDAVSLAGVAGRSFRYEEVAEALVRQLDQHYHRLIEGNLASLESLWKSRLGLLGQDVVAEGTNQTQQGRLLDVTFAGVDLVVSAGEVVRLPPECIRGLRPLEVRD